MSIKKLDFDRNTRMRLVEIRQDLGISQAQFSSKIGISQGTYSDYESGKAQIQPPVLLSICYRFSINEDWIRWGKGEKKSKLKVDNSTENLIKLGRSDINISDLEEAMDDKNETIRAQRETIDVLKSEVGRLKEEIAHLKGFKEESNRSK